MKFVVAVVMLALAAVGVQSSVLVAQHAPAVSYVTSAVHPAGGWGGPWGASGWAGHGAWGGNGAWGGHGAWGGNGAWGGHGAWDGAWDGGHGPAAVAVHASGWGHSGPSHWGGYPGISLAQGPGHGAALGHGHGHEGVYVAKTRGAVHTAPLAGHINSATSLNLAAAPGTH